MISGRVMAAMSKQCPWSVAEVAGRIQCLQGLQPQGGPLQALQEVKGAMETDP